jgi:hypothetical protein
LAQTLLETVMRALHWQGVELRVTRTARDDGLTPLAIFPGQKRSG